MANNDLISRAEAINALTDDNIEQNIDNVYDGERHRTKRSSIRIIAQLPSVNAAPVVHGQWIKMIGMMPPEYHGHYECSECQWHMKGIRNNWTKEEEFLYCPNCGAKMDDKQEDYDGSTN